MLPVLLRLPDWFPFIGGEPITSFGVMMFLAFMIGGLVLRAEMSRAELGPERAWDLVFMAVVGGVVGAKLYYVLLNYDRLVTDPLPLLLSRGGLVWYGGLLGGTALVIWQVRKLGLPLGRMADLTAPALAIGYAVGRVGCFLVGDDYGRPTGAWVGVRFPEGAPPTRVDVLEGYFGVPVDPELVARFGEVVPVHPTQLYEVALTLVIFAFLWKIRRHRHLPGWLFMVWLGLAGAERLMVEFFRVKDDRFLGPITLAQLLSVGLILLGGWGARRLRGPPAPGPVPPRAAAPAPMRAG